MAETLIARTYAEGLRPLGSAAQRNYALIFETVASRLSPAHARMFSEPSPTPDGVATDWYAQTEGPARRLDELGAAEAEAARARIGELTRDVLALADELDAGGEEADRRLGEALRNAVEVPDGDAIWLVGDQPVLVTWAHSRDIDKAPRGVIRRFIPVEPPPAPVPAPAPTHEAAPVPAVERRRPRDLLWWFGWLLLATLLFWALYLLIAPCGLRGPGILNFDMCPRADPGPDALDVEAERREALADRIAALERDLNRAGISCVPETPQAPGPAPEPEPEPEPEREDPVDAVIDEGGEIGTVNIILSWEGTADLDVHVKCPSGETIKHSNKNACGGTLDTDANVGVAKPRPVENVVFSESPTPGTYEVTVRLHAEKQDRNRSRFPFRITIIVDGRRTVHDDSVNTSNRQWTTTFEYTGS